MSPHDPDEPARPASQQPHPQQPPQPAEPGPWQPPGGQRVQPAPPRIPVQRASAQTPRAAQTPPAAQPPPAARTVAAPTPPAQTASTAQTFPAAQTFPTAPTAPAAQAAPAAGQARPFVAQPPAAAQPDATYTVPAIVTPWQQHASTAAGAAAAAPATSIPAAAIPPAAIAPDDGPPRGTVLQSQHALRDARRRALSHRLTALHTGWHVVTGETLRRMTGTLPGTGLILGVDRQRQPILVRLFRPAPTKVTLVGGVWAQRLLAFRALALGARVVLITTDPGAWQGFGELATGRSDRVALWNNPRPPVVPATAQQPALIIADTGAYGGAPLPEPRPWQTQLIVVRQLGTDNVRALQDCDLVIMQRLAAPEASVAVQAMGLTGQSTQLLQLMGEDMFALLDGDTRYVWLSPTGVERQYNGAPRR